MFLTQILQKFKVKPISALQQTELDKKYCEKALLSIENNKFLESEREFIQKKKETIIIQLEDLKEEFPELFL